MTRRTDAAQARRAAGIAVVTGVLAAALATPATGSTTPSAPEPGPPILAYSGAKRVVVVDRKGTVVSRVPRGYGGYSLGGDLLAKAYAGGRSSETIGFDAETGEPRFEIKQTLLIPTVFRGGRAVAFSGGGRRDPYATSLWIRNRPGVERKLIQFSFGGSPGVPTGISQGLVLDYSFDRAGETVAVVAGDDIVNFEYDIWAVDVSTRERVRLTNDHRSRYPTFSPDGEQLAYFREDSICGGPAPGYRGGDLVLLNTDGTGRRVMHDGTCERYFDRPRWLNRHYLVATLHTRRPGEDPQPLYDSRLVLIEPGSRMISRPISKTDRVGHVSVSPSMNRIAYADWTQPNGFWVFTWKPASGIPADQEEWAQGTTRRFDRGRVPHLRGDSTLIPSY